MFPSAGSSWPVTTATMPAKAAARVGMTDATADPTAEKAGASPEAMAETACMTEERNPSLVTIM